MIGKPWLLVGVIVLGAMTFAFAGGCGDDGGGEPEATATTAAGGTPSDTTPSDTTPSAEGAVGITLQEWAVIPDPDSASAGSVTFDVENIGPEEAHEFMVIQTDLEPGDLPTLDDGSVDETQTQITVLDEIGEDELPVGGSGTVTLDLEAGSFALICNVVDEDEQGQPRSHYRNGMFAAFTVE